MKETDDVLKAAPEKAGFLVNRNFALFLIGRMVSLIGDRVFDLTLIVWIATIIARQVKYPFESWAPYAALNLRSARKEVLQQPLSNAK